MDQIVHLEAGINAESDAITRMPNEMWEEILSQISVEGTIRMLEMRQVCRKWSAVVDEHFPVTAIILDDREHHLNLVYDLPVADCVVKRLVAKLPPIAPLFREDCLTNLKIWGPITPANFEVLMSRQTGSLEKLSMNRASLAIPGLMLRSSSKEQRSIYDIVPTSLKTLIIDTHGSPNWAERQICMDNISNIFKCEMPTLNRLSLRFLSEIFTNQAEYDNEVDVILSFLESHPNIQKFSLFCPREWFKKCGMQKLSEPVGLQERVFPVRLVSIKVSIRPIQLKTWLSLINEQRVLKILRLEIIYIHKKDAYILNLLDDGTIENFKQMLLQNVKTLEYIQMKNILFAQEDRLDAETFSAMEKLRYLSLEPHPFQLKICIFNLRQLPTSLEVINLKGLRCGREDVLEMATRLDEIRTVALDDMIWLDEHQLTQEILRAFSAKQHIRSISLSPVSLSELDHQRNGDELRIRISETFVLEMPRADWKERIQYNFHPLP